MKQILPISLALIAIVGLTFIVSNAANDPDVKVITPTPSYATDDLWSCLMQIGLLDRNNLRVEGPPDQSGLLFVYRVYNASREETRAVSIEYGYDSTGSSVVVGCWPPIEWQRIGVPSATPYLLPAEVENGGTPVS